MRQRDRVASDVRSEERETALRSELDLQRATASSRDEELRTALRREEERQTALSREEAEANSRLRASLQTAEVRVAQLQVLNRARSAVGEQECAC